MKKRFYETQSKEVSLWVSQGRVSFGFDKSYISFETSAEKLPSI